MNILRLSILSLITMMVIPIGAYAHCPFHAHCGPGGVDPDDATYSVVIDGNVQGGWIVGHPWSKGGKKNTINGPIRPFVGEFTDLSFFTATLAENPPAFTAAQGAVCFPPGTNFPLHAGGISQGKKGRAEAQFWFEANTFEGGQTLFYQLKLIGVFHEPWLPGSLGFTHVLMDEWRLTATNEGADIKSISCIGEGTGIGVTITVTEL